MAYVLHGGPRNMQLVDDLPRGYRFVHGVTPDSAFDPIDGMAIDAAVWDAVPFPTRTDGGEGERPRLRAL